MLGSAGPSYVVGWGVNPPTHAHHRGASCPDRPAPCNFKNAFSNPGPNPQVRVLCAARQQQRPPLCLLVLSWPLSELPMPSLTSHHNRLCWCAPLWAQVLYGALVGGPADADSYTDLRANFQSNQACPGGPARQRSSADATPAPSLRCGERTRRAIRRWQPWPYPGAPRLTLCSLLHAAAARWPWTTRPGSRARWRACCTCCPSPPLAAAAAPAARCDDA